jgi:hypothetical protein
MGTSNGHLARVWEYAKSFRNGHAHVDPHQGLFVRALLVCCEVDQLDDISDRLINLHELRVPPLASAPSLSFGTYVIVERNGDRRVHGLEFRVIDPAGQRIHAWQEMMPSESDDSWVLIRDFVIVASMRGTYRLELTIDGVLRAFAPFTVRSDARADGSDTWKFVKVPEQTPGA